MKLLKKILFIIGAVLLLSACGQSLNENEETTGSGGTPEQNQVENSKGSSGEKSTKESEENQKQNEQEDKTGSHNDSQNAEENNTETEKIRLMEKNLTFAINGKTAEETAFLKRSDNQDYSVYVLPGYILTGEEPNSDILYLEEDSFHNMRIQLLPKDISIEDAVATMKEQLTAVSDNVVEIENNDGWLKDSHMYQSKNEEDLVTGIIKENTDFILKLTIFTKLNTDYSDPLLKMGETIDSK
ncbi:membrane lipoprotein lipid attachment site-containing protein [Bacillus niameyensis]|uniref:membrane lipoprotein lipid attachment site-containing protein n=1 Tax=Bacillus niameyensis TaxID=1522308 RepID=UPI000783B534|nr:membrane lipoprotein lipid attachment site-containing protein [Bacillus niameyensis]